MENDANDSNRRVFMGNLRGIESGSGEEKRWAATHLVAIRVLSECQLKGKFFEFDCLTILVLILDVMECF